MIDNVLAKDINGLEPRLTREGYNVKVLAELLNAKPREIKEFLRGQLAPRRTQELQNELRQEFHFSRLVILTECEPAWMFSGCS